MVVCSRGLLVVAAFLSLSVCASGTKLVNSDGLVTDDCKCLQDPTLTCCSNWTMPDADIKRDIHMLCSSMDNMVGCGVLKLCDEGKLAGLYCNSFSILGDLCFDMPMMHGCENYTTLCNTKGTKVTMCTNYPSIPNVLTTDQAQDDISKLCTSMPNMPECSTGCVTADGETCNCRSLDGSACLIDTSRTSLIEELSDICLSMGMPNCANFNRMCRSTNQLTSICKKEAQDTPFCTLPGTNMYMTGMKTSLKSTDSCLVFLSETAVIDSKAKLAFALLGCFAMGVINAIFIRISSSFPRVRSQSHFWTANKWRFLRFVLASLQLANGYCLMLLMMSFYLWFLVMGVLGLAFGQVMVSPDAPASEPCHQSIAEAPYRKVEH